MRGTPWQQFDEAEKSAVTPCVTQARDIPCQKPHAQHQSAKKVLTETGLKADVPTSAEIDALRAAAQPAVRAGIWGVARAEPIYRFAGTTLGIIGAGRIGRQFGRKAQALGFAQVLVHDPRATDLPAGWQKASIDQICTAAQVISLHVPLTSETHHQIDARRLALMGPRTILINTSRGGLIDTTALA